MVEERRDHKVYKYTNRVNGKVYIGRTCRTLAKRAKIDGSGYNRCPYFWCAIQKYGWENFEGEILEEGLTDNEAAKKEIYYINLYNSTKKENGYNLTDKDCVTYSEQMREKLSNAAKGRAGHMLGKHHSKEYKEKMSKNLKGTRRGENFHSNRRIICVETGIEYYSLVYAHECTGISYGGISTSLRGYLKGEDHTAGGYHWRYAGEPGEGSIQRSVLCIETGVEYESIAEASRQTDIFTGSIRRSAKSGGERFAGKYHWVFTNKKIQKKVKGRSVLCYETKEEFSSMEEAAKRLGIKGSQIGQAVKFGCRAAGYHWIYLEDAHLKHSFVRENRRRVRCVETGITYESIADARRKINKLSINISSAAREGRIAGGYHWVYVDEKTILT